MNEPLRSIKLSWNSIRLLGRNYALFSFVDIPVWDPSVFMKLTICSRNAESFGHCFSNKGFRITEGQHFYVLTLHV